MSISLLHTCTIVLQDAAIGENHEGYTLDLYVLFPTIACVLNKKFNNKKGNI